MNKQINEILIQSKVYVSLVLITTGIRHLHKKLFFFLKNGDIYKGQDILNAMKHMLYYLQQGDGHVSFLVCGILKQYLS